MDFHVTYLQQVLALPDPAVPFLGGQNGPLDLGAGCLTYPGSTCLLALTQVVPVAVWEAAVCLTADIVKRRG